MQGSNVIRAEGAGSPAVGLMAGITWLGICVFLFLDISPSADGDWIEWAVIAVFGLAGLTLVAQGIRQWLENRRWGQVVFRMDPFPARLGERLSGMIQLPHGLEGGREVILSLSCIETQEREQDRWRKVLWNETQPAARTAGVGRSSRLGVDFPLPTDQPPSSSSRLPESVRVRWELGLEVKGRTGRLRRRFVVPVEAR
ncbi:hypothetical protein [Ectothiorhodospira shaposhnikovii]|uniref:hypothetical protein n=1 Tax=Ectothiorhodospira shaposhnikovii TaxID=1054 RepID=UPI001EE8A4CA|nr:hypothetical protein [Ectothiorhodospira shaposhnikovii]MCG5512149.1 hypothetical protein [Ectothiorhodospira shaposhnikovii]